MRQGEDGSGEEQSEGEGERETSRSSVAGLSTVPSRIGSAQAVRSPGGSA